MLVAALVVFSYSSVLLCGVACGIAFVHGFNSLIHS
jgi:hypothetical protein